ncbi:hypothetical protein LY78DRAFT_679340 [Colletotrichum sublineola]|nr:hypothetical protein LY78DRAFT_679340 [Colletotrichum sublineola]
MAGEREALHIGKGSRCAPFGYLNSGSRASTAEIWGFGRNATTSGGWLFLVWVLFLQPLTECAGNNSLDGHVGKRKSKKKSNAERANTTSLV